MILRRFLLAVAVVLLISLACVCVRGRTIGRDADSEVVHDGARATSRARSPRVRIAPDAGGRDERRESSGTVHVGGWVVDPSGRAAAGARVVLAYADPTAGDSGGDVAAPVIATVSDAAGRFSFEGARRQARTIRLSASAADPGAGWLSRPVSLDLQAEGNPAPVVLVLRRAHVVDYLVVDCSGRPLPGARVEIDLTRPADAVTEHELVPGRVVERANSEGKLRALLPEPGGNARAAAGDGWPFGDPVEVIASAEQVRLVAPTGSSVAELEILVTSDVGRELDEWRVNGTGGVGRTIGTMTGYSRETRSAAFTGPSARLRVLRGEGPVIVAVWSAGHVPQQRLIPTPGSGDCRVRFSLAAVPTLRVRVRDPNGQVLPDGCVMRVRDGVDFVSSAPRATRPVLDQHSDVEVTPPEPLGPHLAGLFEDAQSWSASPDFEGAFLVSFPGSGEWTVACELSGAALHEWCVRVPHDSGHGGDADLELPPGEWRSLLVEFETAESRRSWSRVRCLRIGAWSDVESGGSDPALWTALPDLATVSPVGSTRLWLRVPSESTRIEFGVLAMLDRGQACIWRRIAAVAPSSKHELVRVPSPDRWGVDVVQVSHRSMFGDDAGTRHGHVVGEAADLVGRRLFDAAEFGRGGPDSHLMFPRGRYTWVERAPLGAPQVRLIFEPGADGSLRPDLSPPPNDSHGER